jgi:hypothetical protein
MVFSLALVSIALIALLATAFIFGKEALMAVALILFVLLIFANWIANF